MTSTRGKAACVHCRSRKQKCDGQRPTCGRCKTLDHPCRWSELQKRGPVKGYTESLENRLEEAETALYRLLLTVDEAQVRRAFMDQSIIKPSSWRPLHGDDVPDVHRGRHDVNKAELVGHWQDYPLTNARELARWAASMKSRTTQASNGAQTSLQMDDDLDTGGRIMSYDTAYESSYQIPIALEDQTGQSAPQMRADAYLQNSIAAEDASLGVHAAIDTEEQEAGTSGLDLPKDFKRQFLW